MKDAFLPLQEINQYLPCGNNRNPIEGIPAYTLFPEEIMDAGAPIVSDSLYGLVYGEHATKETRATFLELVQQGQPDIVELAEDINSDIGLRNPIEVKRKGKGYAVFSGARRWLASTFLWVREGAKKGVGDKIKVRISSESDDLAAQAACSVNLFVRPLDPVSEGEFYARMSDRGMTRDEIAARFLPTKSKSAALQHISRRIKLATNLTPAQKDRVRAGELGITRAEGIIANKLSDEPRKKKASSSGPALWRRPHLETLYNDPTYLRAQFCRNLPQTQVEYLREFLAYLLDVDYAPVDGDKADPGDVEVEEVLPTEEDFAGEQD